MKEYYSKRAQEYEKIYHRDDPVRHAELAEISRLMQELFFRLDVLEVACGTGYWTERIARSARSVTAVDISEETLRIARQKNIEGAEVRFIQGTHIVRTRSTASSTRVHTDKPCVFVDIRTTAGIDVCEYPDSGKINILPYQEIYQGQDKVGYYLNEDKPPRNGRLKS